MKRRNTIFEASALNMSQRSKPKRSTLRLRQYFKGRKFASKIHLSTIINNSSDRRYYASVQFLTFTELGLYDTGANVSCLGSDLASLDFSTYKEFCPLKSFVRTADGVIQKVKGYLNVNMHFKNKMEKFKF